MSNNEVVKSVNKFCSSKGIVLYSRYDIYLIYIIIQYTKYAYCTALLVHMYLVSTCFYHMSMFPLFPQKTEDRRDILLEQIFSDNNACSFRCTLTTRMIILTNKTVHAVVQFTLGT